MAFNDCCFTIPTPGNVLYTPLPDKVYIAVIPTPGYCGDNLGTSFSVDWNGNGWSGNYGAPPSPPNPPSQIGWNVDVELKCDDPPDGAYVTLSLSWVLRDASDNVCDSGGPSAIGGIACNDIWAHFAAFPLKSECCGLGPGHPTIVDFHVTRDPPVPNGKLPTVVPPCEYVPDDCCSEPPPTDVCCDKDIIGPGDGGGG